MHPLISTFCQDSELEFWGGGIYLEITTAQSTGGLLKITGNTIENNEVSSAISLGGALFIQNNDAHELGYPIEITGNNIRNNSSLASPPDGLAGGIFIDEWQRGFINENNIYGNTCSVSFGREITSFSSKIIDAENNWWGEGTTSGTVEDKVDGPIDTDPVATAPFNI